mmetsp:Transcript_122310/g.340909  ORF Transcript_122310/g.340909 Transcript_122310/m.340909 type:complete len:126 (+) Transcript_122310:1-378(+)
MDQWLHLSRNAQDENTSVGQRGASSMPIIKGGGEPPQQVEQATIPLHVLLTCHDVRAGRAGTDGKLPNQGLRTEEGDMGVDQATCRILARALACLCPLLGIDPGPPEASPTCRESFFPQLAQRFQ